MIGRVGRPEVLETVWLVWDHSDVYGPDPTERFVHATKESAERYRDERIADDRYGAFGIEERVVSGSRSLRRWTRSRC
jgi:hypothetical protein